jgi:putative component of membrane protein insertase Oxa1/YidC/SpoIIIJ protein YidD
VSKKTGNSGFAYKSIKFAPNCSNYTISEISRTSAIQKWYDMLQMKAYKMSNQASKLSNLMEKE